MLPRQVASAGLSEVTGEDFENFALCKDLNFENFAFLCRKNFEERKQITIFAQKIASYGTKETFQA